MEYEGYCVKCREKRDGQGWQGRKDGQWSTHSKGPLPGVRDDGDTIPV